MVLIGACVIPLSWNSVCDLIDRSRNEIKSRSLGLTRPLHAGIVTVCLGYRDQVLLERRKNVKCD